MTVTSVSDEVARRADEANLLTIGVEEEYLLVDGQRPHAVPAVEEVLDHLPGRLREQVQHELLQTQIEVASAPGLELRELWDSLRSLREGLAEAADRAGVRLLAVGACPTAGPPADVVDKPRYHRMLQRFGDLSPGQGSNGMHIHVGIADPELGVQVLNHLRPWLPVLQAATTNSPFHEGADTRYASWRSVMWERWPTVGPSPYLESAEHYASLLERLITSGAMLDEGMLYWYARLSANYPTVEIRIGDVCPTLDDAMLVAALARALAATVLRDVQNGVPAPRPEPALLSAAHWRAAHDGLEGSGFDVFTGELRPAWHLLRRLFDLVRPELQRHGDLEIATVLLGRLRARGTGAARQRSVYARHGEFAAVVDYLADQTRGRTGGEPAPDPLTAPGPLTATDPLTAPDSTLAGQPAPGLDGDADGGGVGGDPR